jgi:transposase InsO family protein
MSALLKALPQMQELAPHQQDEWSRLTDAQREQAMALESALMPAVLKVRQMGISTRTAADWLAKTQAAQLGVSASTVRRRLYAYLEGGIMALVPQYKGRQREQKGCEALILEYYQRPSQPDAGDISFWLKQDHNLDVPRHWIRRYLKSLPSNLAETSPKRLGQHYYDQNIRPHHRRNLDDVAVGEVWVSDGHRIKLVSRHPNTQDLFRVEITPVVDKASNYLYGFWVAANESAMDTVYALCSVMARYDHVPTWFQTDPGPGFKNKRVAGLLSRLGIEHVPTRKGNARGKDFGEGFFRIFNKRFSKQYDTFCGDDRTDDALARMRTKVKRGELYVPDLAELREALERFRNAYNAWPQPTSDRLKGKAPNDLIGNLKKNPLSMPVADLLRPSGVATVRQWEIRFRNRFYRHADLKAYEGRKVIYQYDEHEDSKVWIRDHKHRLICVAPLVEKIGWAKENVAADVRERSRQAAVTRKQNQIDEINQRARMPLTAADMVAALDGPAPAELPSGGEEMLAMGHSFNPPKAVTSQPAARQGQVIDLEEVRAAIRASEQSEETPEQRFGHWLSLRKKEQAGETLGLQEQNWYRQYSDSSECQGQLDVFEAFGYLPGLANEEGPAATGPSDTTGHNLES